MILAPKNNNNSNISGYIFYFMSLKFENNFILLMFLFYNPERENIYQI